MAPPVIDRMLRASTDHLSSETLEWFEKENGCERFYNHAILTDGPGQWLVWLDLFDNSMDINAPDDLRRLIVLARAFHCCWLCVDCDADIIDGVPVFGPEAERVTPRDTECFCLARAEEQECPCYPGPIDP